MTCKTHHECVKLIKKTGDTLALKVYTSPQTNPLHHHTNSSNFASTSINPLNSTMSSLVYQSPHHHNHYHQQQQQQQQQQSKSYSYYASSTIGAAAAAATANGGATPSYHYGHQHHYHHQPHLSEIQNRADLNALFLDGTKSLPSKKKRKFLNVYIQATRYR